jgi:hypothetical protein
MELNSTQAYLDIVCDKGYITEYDYNNFLRDVGATGYSYAADVELFQRRVYIPADGQPNTVEVYYVLTQRYASVEGGVHESYALEKGDLVSVKLTKIEKTKTSKGLAAVLKLYISDTPLKLEGMVRNNG